MQLEGKVKIIGETETFGNNGFRKRELVITTDEQYPQHISIEFVQDKCDLLNAYRLGETVKVSINIRGREWTSPQGDVKYFNSIQGWRIEGLASSSGVPNVPPIEAFDPSDNLDEHVRNPLPF